MPSPRRAASLSLPALLLSALAVGCAPAIGDECDTALDCSSQGSRECDRTQRGGYCTIRGCERGTCPEDSVCVKFRPSEPRLAVTYCMASCDERSDCRTEHGYRCLGGDDFGDGMDALVLDGESRRFCAQPLTPGEMSSLPDAGRYTPGSGDDDGGAAAPEDDAGSE